MLFCNEFQLPITREIFWTDSEAVLGYIRNQSRKFKVFLANRIEIIQEIPVIPCGFM